MNRFLQWISQKIAYILLLIFVIMIIKGKDFIEEYNKTGDKQKLTYGLLFFIYCF